MTERIVVLDGQSSYLLFGDDDDDQSRFETTDEEGRSVSGALPYLLSEGYSVKMAVPVPGSSTVVFVLSTSQEGSSQES